MKPPEVLPKKAEKMHIFPRGKASNSTKALFSCEKFLDFGIVALLFVCDKYCPIID